MCGPMLGLVGGLMSGIGGMMQANSEAASLKAQGLFKKRQGDMERIAGSTEIMSQKRGEERILGTQQVQYASAGIDPSTGSPLVTAQAPDKEAEMDRQSIRFGRDLKATNLDYEAKIDNMNAKAAKTRGMFSLFSGVMSGFTSLGSSFGMA